MKMQLRFSKFLCAGLCAAVFLVFALPPSVATAQSSESTLKKILDRGHLIVGSRTTTPGFGFKDKGKLVGFDIDMAREIANGLLGSPDKVKFVVLASGSQRVPALVSGRVDMVVTQFSVFRKRAQVVGFTLPYCNADFSAIVRADSPYRKNADLNGKVVTTRRGAELEKLILGAIPQAKVEMYPNLSDAFLAFRQGRAEAMFNDHAGGIFLTRTYPGKYRVITDLENPLDANQYSIGVRQDDLVWLNYLNWVLHRMALTGKLQAIHKKWLGTTDLVPGWARNAY